MEFFNKAQGVRLRSHLDKFLVADEDQETVRQSKKGSARKARWTVEPVEGNNHFVRLKSCHGRYLAASDVPFLLGMTGKKVLQSTKLEPAVEWEPIREGFQVKLRTRAGKFLRANGATPPWRNSITHDIPHRTATQNWVLWDIDAVEIPEVESFGDYESLISSLSSLSDELVNSDPNSPWSVKSPRLSSNELGMELFNDAKSVRLRSHHDKYLLAEEDEESVCQDRNGSCRNARWTVEFVEGANLIRLKSCYDKYLTASHVPFLLGMSGKKVLQTLPRRLDSSLEWEPSKEGSKVKLKTRYGKFLRANSGVPWLNSVTHDIPYRTSTQDWVLWDVEVVEKLGSPSDPSSSPTVNQLDPPANEPVSRSLISLKSHKLSKLLSSYSLISSSPKSEGRTIYFSVADENGEVEDAKEGPFFIFKGNGLEELTQKLEEETGLEDITVYSRNPLNGKLYRLHLQLPPNNMTMHVVVVASSSKAARDFSEPANPTTI